MRILWFVLGALGGIVAGALIALGVGGVIDTVRVGRAQREILGTWKFEEVLVARRKLEPGEVVPREAVATLSMPTPIATRSVLRPDAAGSVVGHRSSVEIPAGEPLMASYFGGTGPALDARDRVLAQECRRALEEGGIQKAAQP